MLTLEYVAGLFDGEGCITVQRQWYVNTEGTFSYRYPMRAQITNTYEPIIVMLTEQFPYGSHFVDKRNPNYWRKTHVWYANGANAILFVSTLLPHLVIKKKQVQLAVELDTIIREYNAIVIASSTTSKNTARKLLPRGHVIPREEVERREAIIQQIWELNGGKP